MEGECEAQRRSDVAGDNETGERSAIDPMVTHLVLGADLANERFGTVAHDGGRCVVGARRSIARVAD